VVAQAVEVVHQPLNQLEVMVAQVVVEVIKQVVVIDQEEQEILLQCLQLKEQMEEMLVDLYMQVGAVVVQFVLVNQVSPVHQVQVEQVLQLLFQVVQFKEQGVEADLPIQVQQVQDQVEQQELVVVEKVCQEQDLILMEQIPPAVEGVEARPEDQVIVETEDLV
jgi:hypothetical protein